MSAARITAGLEAVCDGLAVTTLLALIVSRVEYRTLGLPRGFELEHLVLLGLVLGLVVLRRLGRRWDPALMLLAASVLGTSALGLVGAMWAGANVGAALKLVVAETVMREHPPAAIHRPDDRYGYVLVAGARDRHRTTDFDVTYTIDADGRRLTPTPPVRRTTVAFVGDSYTFGIGVNDAETFTARLGTLWPEVKVVNAAAGGWGLTQAYLMVTDLLAQPHPPEVIVNAMIPDDLSRSYLRSPVTAGVKRRLEFVGDTLEFRAVREGPPPPITPELLARELEVNRTLLVRMAEACARQGVAFSNLLLADAGRYPPDLMLELGRRGIQTVDLTRVPLTRFTHDHHPNAQGHEALTRAIAASPIAAMVRDRMAQTAGAGPGR